jgi:hypothetical protein
MNKRRFTLIGGILVISLVMLAVFFFFPGRQAAAAPEIFASPVQGGCYIAGPSDCRIHLDPFTINLATSKKLTRFQLVAIQGGSGVQTTIFDFRPDQSNPVPLSGSTYTPSLVAQDFAATCGKSYMISLQGQDTGDVNMLNLGMTGQFTCPASIP